MKINLNEFTNDRPYIENKFHDTKKSFDSLRRFDFDGCECPKETGISSADIDAGLKRISDELAEHEHATVKSRLFEYVLDNTRFDINEHDYFPTVDCIRRPLGKYTVGKWSSDAWESYTEMRDALGHCGAAWIMLDYDHTIPDWDSVIKLGFGGILEALERSYAKKEASGEIDEEKKIFFSAMKTEYEAILRFIERMADYADKIGHKKASLAKKSLLTLKAGGAENSFDVLMAIYLYFIFSEHIDGYQVRSLGYGLDTTLAPYVMHDVQRGIFTEEEISNFIAYFLMQFSAIGNYWGQPIYLGGTDLNGNTTVNDLSFTILEIYDMLGIYNPKLQIKVSKSTPNDFLKKAVEIIKGGASSIVFINEDTAVRSLMAMGASYQEALDFAISGCYEYRVKAKSIDLSISTINALSLIERVFHQGYDREENRLIGEATKSILEMESFEEFYEAYKRQLAYIVGRVGVILDGTEKKVSKINPSIIFSATISKCRESLTDALAAGIENTRVYWFNGFASAVDSLMAVYELVFEKKLTTLKELKLALDANWQGYEKLRLMAKAAKHKYGRGDKLADYYARALHVYFESLVSGQRSVYGGKAAYELHSARSFIDQSKSIGATPDGRFAGDESSKNASPSIGADTNGVTALISSATSLDMSLSCAGACLDAMLHPSAVAGEDGTEAFLAVLRTYMDKGGASIHFNVFNADILRDAQAHPEKYKNLQVRVCGWNVLWNNMAKSEQDAYIKRAESII